MCVWWGGWGGSVFVCVCRGGMGVKVQHQQHTWLIGLVKYKDPTKILLVIHSFVNII